jgi:subtilisin family serine protease
LKIRLALLVASILGLLTAPVAPTVSAATAPAKFSQPYDASTVLVGFKPGTTKARVASIVATLGARDLRAVGAGTHVLGVSGSVPSMIAKLRGFSNVRYAEPNWILHAQKLPNDPRFDQLWGLRNTGQTVNGIAGTRGADISAEPAWSVTTGSASVVIGVVDTGIDYTHPDLAANVWTNTSGINGCLPGTHGYNAILTTCEPLDDNRHGTHVSGTIGAVGNNGIGVTGVNWTTSMMALKFLSAAGIGLTDHAVAAIDWAVKAKKAGVNLRALNNSWGGGGFSQALADEISVANANDILFVVAAGNDRANNDDIPTYPCSYGIANEVCVAATDQNDNLASFSNHGVNSVDLAAPGTNILSTTPGGMYAYLNGTSMATPHVTGAAGLILSTGYQSVATLKSTILRSVDPLASLSGLTRTGGRLNVCRAIPTCAAPSPPPPPPPPPAPGDGEY